VTGTARVTAQQITRQPPNSRASALSKPVAPGMAGVVFPSEPPASFLRLSYSAAEVPDLVRATEILAEVLDAC